MSEHSKPGLDLREVFKAAAALQHEPETDYPANRYHTVLGPVEAARITDQNIRAIAYWCSGKVVERPLLDIPDPVRYIKLKTHDRHDNAIEDTAIIGEWVVADDDGQGRFSVYADNLFLKLIVDKDVKIRNVFPHDEIVKLVDHAMEYQALVEHRGDGTVEESSAVAEFVALQIAKLFR